MNAAAVVKIELVVVVAAANKVTVLIQQLLKHLLTASRRLIYVRRFRLNGSVLPGERREESPWIIRLRTPKYSVRL